jgi:hypothetical protein
VRILIALGAGPAALERDGAVLGREILTLQAVNDLVLPDCETHVRPTFAFHSYGDDDLVAGELLQDSLGMAGVCSKAKFPR